MKNDEPSKKDKQLNRLVKEVLKSSKYRNVCEDLIRNIGERELAKGQDLKVCVKSTKSKLHQICGAYFLGKPDYGTWLEQLGNAKRCEDKDLFRKTCEEIMGHHHSTRERLKILDQFCNRIFSLLPPIHSVMDVACGFHPLSFPWMPLSDEVRYYAYDVYKDLIEFLNDFMIIANIQGRAETRDVLRHPPEVNTDLAFILNTLPCFEQIEKSAGLKLLESIKANFLLVSFPVRSLRGRKKNMREHYEAEFDKLTRGKDWIIQRLEFMTELVFLITKKL